MTDQLALVLPEIVLLAAACLILVVDLFVTDKKRGITFLLTELTLFVAFFLSFDIWSTGAPSQVLFQGALVSDSLSHVLKLGIYLTSAIAILYARDYINARSFLRGEFYVLSLFAVLGMSILVSAVHLLTVYLGLELLSLSLYAMVAMRRDDSNAPEAAMKYFVMGAIASGFLLYGASLLYGTTGTLELSVISALDTSEPLVLFSMLFIMAGIAFKLGLVPFHMWVPDVYQGGPTAVVSFLAAAPKIAAFGLVYRVMVEGLNAWSADWQLVFGVMAVLSIAVGNVVALVQSNLKRLFAYSTIAHMGYFLLGIISGSDLGFAASLFYILTYAVISLGGFGLLLLMSRAGYECETLSDVRGLWHANPWYGLMFLLVMLSMAGVPPLVGFWPKLQVLTAAVNAGYVELAVTAALFSVVGAFYYLKVIKTVFFEEPSQQFTVEVGRDARLAFGLNGLAMIAFGLFPGALMAVCAQIFAAM